jgi:long-chain fatty acid transport protein
MCNCPDKTAGNLGLLPALLATILALCFALAGLAHSDEFHYVNILVGDRAAGLGGAYTAVSDDPSGLYHNPAGTALTQEGNLSGSMNAYHSTWTEYDDVLGGEGWERKSHTLIPNFFGVLQPLGPGVLGFSYAVPDSIREDQDQTFQDLSGTAVSRFVINFNLTDNTYNVGPSYSLPLHDRLAVGLTLYGHFREREHILNQLIELDNGKFQWANVYFETDEYGVRPILGLIWEPAEKWSLGLSLSRTWVLSADTQSQLTLKDVDFDADMVEFTKVDSNDRRMYPLTVALGLAYFPTNSLLFSVDFRYYDEVNDVFGKRESTWNAALGLEYYLTNRWVVRAGAFTDRANTPDLDSGELDQNPHVNIFGGSASISLFTRNSSVSLGASYGKGDGEDQVIGGDPDIQDVTVTTFTVYLAASYQY